MNPIVIVAIVFGISFLAMIPFLMWNNKKKKKAEDFASQNSHQAILHIYGNSPVIDGVKIKDMEYMKGPDLEYMVSLSPGKHTIECQYESGAPKCTTERITSNVMLECGHEYTISLYFYSPEQRANYYKGDVGETVSCDVLRVSGGAYSEGYIICYKEK